MAAAAFAPLLLSGRAVGDDGSFGYRHLLIKEGRIASLTRHRPAVPAGINEVVLGPEDWIFSGFLDLHNHPDYNFLPLWDAPDAPYENRFSWRRSQAYSDDIKTVHEAVLAALESPEREATRMAILFAVFAEVQALAGGTTTLQEAWSLEEERVGLPSVLLRSTARNDELGLPAHQSVLSVVDFFEPGPCGTPREKTRWNAEDGRGATWLEHYVHLRDQGALSGCLVHLAEGRSGVGTAGVDAYTRAEFEAFLAHPAFADVGRVRDSRLTLIHSCGVDTDNADHLTFLRERDIAVLWSPVSNLLLYSDTLDVARLLGEGIRVALGSDWSPSGSKHVWEEARFARFLIDAAGFPVSDAQIMQMITTTPAACLGQTDLGRLAAGAWADLVVLRSPVPSDAPLEALFRSSDRHVRAVLVGGRALYGERSLLQALGVEHQSLPLREGTAVADKVVSLPTDLRPESPFQFTDEVDKLEDFLKSLPGRPRGVLRSNLLVDSDRPYRKRMVGLREHALQWADTVRERRRPRTVRTRDCT